VSPKGPGVNGLVSSLALWEDDGNFKRWGLVRGLQVIENRAQRGLCGSSISLSLYASWLP
jgi:hypothetical protein